MFKGYNELTGCFLEKKISIFFYFQVRRKIVDFRTTNTEGSAK